MANNNPTITSLKASFLRTQINTLSTPLRPSPAFLTSQASKDDALPQKTIDDALLKLNAILKKHNQLAYGPQATRHVAEQIDRLYWGGERETMVGGAVPGEEWMGKGADMTNPEIIAQLPSTWSEEATELAPEKAAQFEELQQKLVELDERRRLAKEKVERYKAMKELLAPFEGVENVQGNIVTKNGEVEKELERMKLLLLRVERGVSALEPTEESGDMEMEVDEDGEENVLAILGGD